MVHATGTKPIKYSLYYGTFVDAPSYDKLKIRLDTLIGVNEKGFIDYIKEEYSSFLNNGKSVLQFFLESDFASQRGLDESCVSYMDNSDDGTKFFFPGFVDTHIHASQYPNTGIGLEYQLLSWLTNLTFPLENSFTDSNKEGKLALAAEVYRKVIQKTLNSGTTCASYFATTDGETTQIFTDLLLTLGQRGFVGKVCQDHNPEYPDYAEDYHECKENMKCLIEYCSKANPEGEVLVTPIVTPRFAPVCSSKLLRYLGELAEIESLPIQTHISENKEEIKLVSNKFPEFENYAAVYDGFKLLSQRTILAHAVHLTDDECKLIKKKNSSISHCPTSNTFICSGEAPVRKYLHKFGINVSLGTDVSGGYDSSILEIMKQAILVSHHKSIKAIDEDINPKLSVDETCYMATQGGAIAVGLGEMIGSFDVSKKWDAQLIDLRSTGSKIDIFAHQIPSLRDKSNVKQVHQNIRNLLGKWIFCGDDRNCVKVWCNGRIVIDKVQSNVDHFVLVDKV